MPTRSFTSPQLALAVVVGLVPSMRGLAADPAPQPAQQPAPQPASQPAPQPATDPATPPAPAAGQAPKREPLPPITWSDAEIEKIAKMLTGSWKSSMPVPEGGNPSESVEVGMFIAPVRVRDMTDMLYVESARMDSVQAPYRQGFFQIFRFRDGLRLRTFELARRSGGAMVGMWTNPDLFPSVERADLVATMDIDLKPDGDGFSGKSPAPYATSLNGAVEMTSELSLRPDRIITADRGFNAKGEIVWGAKADATYEYQRIEAPVKTWTSPNGVFVIEYGRGDAPKVAVIDDIITVHYLGFLSNGFRFDSSVDRVPPNPLTFLVTEKQVIVGFVDALLGSNVGTIRRAYIPHEKAYGEFGNQRVRIPPFADLYFDFEVMKLETPVGPRPAIPAAPSQSPRLIDEMTNPQSASPQPASPQPANPEPASPEPASPPPAPR